MFLQPPSDRACPAHPRPSVHTGDWMARGREGEGKRRDAFLKGSGIQQNHLHGICGEGLLPVIGHRSIQQESDFILNIPPLLEALLWLPTSHSPNSSAAHPRLPRLLTSLSQGVSLLSG